MYAVDVKERNLITVEIPKKHRVGKGLKESKEERRARQLETPVQTLLLSPRMIMKSCDFPHPFSLLARTAVIRHRLVDETNYSIKGASDLTQTFGTVSVDESPFEYIDREIGGIPELLKEGNFFSFREVQAYLSRNSFLVPVLIPLVTHIPHCIRLDTMKLAITKVFDRGPYRTIRLAYADEVTDILYDGGEMLVRPPGRH